MFTARVWKNTGYNGINIPDNPATLEAMTHTDFSALDILTDMNLEEVKLHGTESDFRNVDYVRIFDNTHSTYYKVFGTPTPINGDTWIIPLTTDGVLTAGGISNIIFLDGVTTRVSTADDDFGKYCLEDELLTPAEPLQLEVRPISVDNKTTVDGQGNVIQDPLWEENVFVETTIDLGLMACIDGTVEYETDSGEQVLVPHSYPKMGRHTSYSYAGLPGVDTKTTVYPVGNNYDGKDPIQEGIQKCRALGIESAIFNQVSIPKKFIVAVTQAQEVGDRLDTFGTVADSFCNFENPDTQQGETRTDIGKYNGFAATLYPSEDPPIRKTTYVFIREMQALGGSINTLLAFEYDNTVKNKRVLYGANNTYGMLTTAGNRSESKPEELVGGNEPSPNIIFKADPHLTGGPYYRFEYINGQKAEDQSFFYNAIKGLSWKRVPLVFTETSGSALNTVAFENSRRIADTQFNTSWSGIAANLAPSVASGINDLKSRFSGISPAGAFQASTLASRAVTVAPVGAGTAIVPFGAAVGGAAAGGGTAFGGMLVRAGAVAGAASAPLAAAAPVIGGAALATGLAAKKVIADYENYVAAKISEISALAAKNNVSSPTVQITYDAEAFRDFYGEVLFIYRYKPTASDLARMDKLLTMYGYRASIPINDVNLNSRTKFNYLEADVSIGGDIPMYLKEIIRAQLSAGVRIWHKKPDVADYTNNPIRSNTP